MRQQVSIEDIKDRLLDRLDAVISAYAPAANGSHTTHGRFFTLNPGRADRSVGSFCITVSGVKAGRWNDYATGEHGDVLDLIRLSCNTDGAGAIKEARAFLGLDTESPELRRQRDQAAVAAKRRRADQEAKHAQDAAKKRKRAEALWLSGRADILGTPVDHYLRARSIDLSMLAHLPGAIRYHPECRYYFEAEETDRSTGEVRRVLQWRPYPAMVTAIARGPHIIDCHRTYLAFDDQAGLWIKAPDMPKAKKVFTDYTGGSIRLSGELGPRGGRLKLGQAPEGARVFVAEGIENALSLMMLRQLRGQPPAFVVAAGAIWNMAEVELPATIRDVTLCADNDTGPQAQAQLQKAIDFHAGKGRTVRVWRSDIPGEDLNDALRRAMKEKEGAA